MYLLREAGQPLSLQYEAKPFGPHAPTLRQVFIKLDTHCTRGYGDGKDSPTKPSHLLPGAVEEASAFLADEPETRARMDRIAALIYGFEDPYGLELLSTIHWGMRTDPLARENASVAIAAVQEWSPRRKERLKGEHLLRAWERLKEQGWDRDIAA